MLFWYGGSLNTKICKESLYLENNNIYLRPLRIEDITDSYVNGLNEPEVNKYLVYVGQKIQTFKSVVEYVQSNMENPRNILFGIFRAYILIRILIFCINKLLTF